MYICYGDEEDGCKKELEEMIQNKGQTIYRTNTSTEDYEIALKKELEEM